MCRIAEEGVHQQPLAFRPVVKDEQGSLPKQRKITSQCELLERDDNIMFRSRCMALGVHLKASLMYPLGWPLAGAIVYRKGRRTRRVSSVLQSITVA